MAGKMAWWRVMVVVVVVVPSVAGFMGKQTPPAVPSDIKYIKCQVCELLAKNAHRTTKDLLEPLSGEKAREEHLIEAMEKLTDPFTPEGQWIAKVDLVEKGNQLLVKEMKEVGECGRECKTVRRAAEQILGEHDTDLAEKMFTEKLQRAQLTNWLCYQVSKACVNKPPPLPKDRKPGPAFKPLGEQEQQLQSTLSAMKAQGLGGEVYSREEAMRKYMELSEELDEDMDLPYGDIAGLDDEEEGVETKKGKKSRGKGQGGGSAQRATAAARDLLGQVRDAAEGTLEKVKSGVAGAYQKAKDLLSKLTSRSTQDGEL